MKSKFFSTRWILLAAGIIAIIGLTGMNVYSLMQLKESTLEFNRESKELQILEFADRVRYRLFLEPFEGMNRVDMEQVEDQFRQNRRFPDDVNEIMQEVDEEAIYNGIYFMPGNGIPCSETGGTILRYRADSNSFESVGQVPESVCDGLSFARNNMNSVISDFSSTRNYIFDTHRSLNLALFNVNERNVFGYLHFPINRTVLVQKELPHSIRRHLGDGDEGMNVWIRDWTRNEIIASNTSEEYRRDKIDIWQSFPETFDGWALEVQVTNDAATAAANSSFIKNLVVLGVAVLLLLGALVFMFYTAQRERSLAQRQAGFLANVTHELKTPLAVMQAAGENLADGRVDDQNRLKSYGNHIYSEAIRLRKMIEKLLDVAKADAGQALIEPKPVYLNDVLERYLKENEAYITGKGFQLTTDIDAQVPMCMIDTDSFETIVGNLLENALKYSNDEKELHISLHHRDKNLIMKVQDSGVGIPKSAQKHVFDKFYRVEDAMTAQTKGHGLGLSIVKNLVELNGGDISVKSQQATGSTFTVRFPVLVNPEQQLDEYRDGTPEYTPSQISQEKPKYAE
ncbi:MAG: HAMP domain-containing sensor histidine kinase [Balneolaceae bacterium]|nr:HAMP domain-containing sensor histidine kinase [Balneolaceae bacterium]